MSGFNVYDAARSLGSKSERALEDQVADHRSSDRIHPSARGHQKPKPMSMAPNPENKRKHYGMAFDEEK